jgi:hypothetical protein
MSFFNGKRNYFILDMSILYLATTPSTTVSYCATSCSGAFNPAGSSSCSKVCDDTGSSCSSASTICPNSASGSSPITIAGPDNSYCNSGSSYASYYSSSGGSYTSTNGFGVSTSYTLFYYYNPCGGGGTNTGAGGTVPAAGTCCVYDSGAGDYFCIYSSCSAIG